MASKAVKYENAIMLIHSMPAPPPFNPEYDPKADARFREVSKSMQDDGYYSNHTRQECKEEWRKRYEKLKAVKS